MTIKTTITYDTPAEFEYDNTQIAVGSDARLRRQPEVEQYDEEFSSDVGFTYDNTKAEFTLGDNLGLLADYEVDGNSDASEALGSKTASVVGGSSVAGGLLSFDATPINYVDYIDTLNLPQGNEGCIRFTMKPNYIGNPPNRKNLVNLYKGLEDAGSKVSVHHNTNGVITTVLFDDQGGYVIAFDTAPLTSDGVSFYEFELNFNMTTGDYRLFRDGILVSSDLGVATGTRGETGVFRIGGLYLAASAGDGLDADISEVAVFNTVQHTANYIPGSYTVIKLVQQLPQVPANSIFGVKFDTFDKNWDAVGNSLVGVLNGAPSLVGGKLECIGVEGIAYDYVTTPLESHKFIYTPNYTGNPVSNINILTSWNGVNNNDAFRLINSAAGSLRVQVWDDSSVSVLALTIIDATFSAVSGQDYEFEVAIDSVTGEINLFIDGIKQTTLAPAPWSRGSIASKVAYGASAAVYNLADASFDDCITFEDIQHTASYTPGYTIAENVYVESRVDLPSQSHGHLIDSMVSFLSTFNGTPRFLVSGKYWNGATWVVSDSSFAQATAYADMLANIASIDVLDESSVDLSIIFPDTATISSVISTELVYNAQGDFSALATILHKTLITMNNLAIITNDTVLIGSDEVRYTVLVNGLELWFNTVTSEWIAVNGTIVTTNTLTEINANSQTLAIQLGAEVQIKAYLISTNVETTPVLTSITVAYTWGILDGCDVKTCTVWGCVLDNAGVPIAGAKITVDGADFFYTNSDGIIGADRAALISRSAEGYTNAEGEWGIEVVETTSDATTVDFVIEYSQNGKKIKQKYTGLTIPDQVAIPLGNLVNP